MKRHQGGKGKVQSTPTKLVVFILGSVSFAVDVDHVQRVIPACAVTPFPEARAATAGFIRYDGQPIPVIDPAGLFRGRAMSRISISSRFLMIRPRRQLLALIADDIAGVQDMPAGILPDPQAAALGFTRLGAIASGQQDLIYIVDPEKILTLEEEAQIEAALSALVEPAI